MNSGNIKAANNGKAIAVSDPQSTGGNDVKLNVAGGNVVGGIQVEESIKDAKPVAVSGGTFKDTTGAKVDVSEYLAAGKQQNSDGSVGNKSYYYYPSTSDTTTSTTTKGSPKTFDAGIALYVGMALTSVTGLAYTGKKKF